MVVTPFRERFQNSKNQEDAQSVSSLLRIVLLDISNSSLHLCRSRRVCISRIAKTKEIKIASVHLLDWPKAQSKLVSGSLEQKMDIVRTIVSSGLMQRKMPISELDNHLRKLQSTANP